MVETRFAIEPTFPVHTAADTETQDRYRKSPDWNNLEAGRIFMSLLICRMFYANREDRIRGGVSW